MSLKKFVFIEKIDGAVRVSTDAKTEEEGRQFVNGLGLDEKGFKLDSVKDFVIPKKQLRKNLNNHTMR